MTAILILIPALLLAACGDMEPGQAQTEPEPETELAASENSDKKVLEVYKSPSCSCCGAWVEHMEANGYQVEVHEQQNLQDVKARAGILPGHGSCHTAFIDGYVIEGHVPAREVDRLLVEKPDARGLTVPGMPVGSPGMEMGGRVDAYEVLLFDEEGTEVFASYPGNQQESGQ